MAGLLRRIGSLLLQGLRMALKPPVTSDRLPSLIPPDDPRTLIRPLEEGDWLCPCCAERVQTPQWSGEGATLLEQQEVHDHLFACLSRARREGTTYLRSWEELVLATVQLRLRHWPNYRITKAAGEWICPHCLRPTDVIRRNWDGSETEWEWFLPGALQHLRGCPLFNQMPLSPHSDLEVRGTLGVRDLHQLLFERVANDPVFQVFDDAGMWIDPFSERPIPSLNRRVLPWGTALQNAVTTYLLSAQCTGSHYGWQPKKSVAELQRAAGRLANLRRESGRRLPSARSTRIFRAPALAGASTQARAELQSAREVQLRLLPRQPPTIPGYRVSACYEPCAEVSGDMFHFLDAGLGHTGFLVGDVSGHGAAAALLMTSVVKAFLIRGQGERSPAQALKAVYRDICDDIPKGRFVTVFYAVLHPPTGVVTYARAGHCPALLLEPSKGQVAELLGPGQAMGLMERGDFETSLREGQAVIPNGGSLLLFTGGVLEAFNARHEGFGVERLKEVLRANGNRSSQAQVEAIMGAVRGHIGGRPAEDDQTVVVVRRGAL